MTQTEAINRAVIIWIDAYNGKDIFTARINKATAKHMISHSENDWTIIYTENHHAYLTAPVPEKLVIVE